MPATLPLACPRCGASTTTLGKFCPRCGAENFVEPALAKLHASAGIDRFAAFLPHVALVDGVGPIKVLELDAAVPSLDSLYSLAGVRAAYPAGLDARDMAWIWRRLLSILAFMHGEDVVHAAVFPEKVLIEPLKHGVIVGGWWAPVVNASANRLPVENIAEKYKPWFRDEAATRLPPTPELDVSFAARCMIDLVGGDPISGRLGGNVEPALHRYFERCLRRTGATGKTPGAAELLFDFDRLIEALWGPRKYRPLALPPKKPTETTT